MGTLDVGKKIERSICIYNCRQVGGLPMIGLPPTINFKMRPNQSFGNVLS